MKIKANDNVKVKTGKNRGKTGKVLQVLPDIERVSVEGINTTIKNLRPKKGKDKGQRITFSAPIALSNVALLCPKCGTQTRVGFKLLDTGKKVRVCKKCKEVID